MNFTYTFLPPYLKSTSTEVTPGVLVTSKMSRGKSFPKLSLISSEKVSNIPLPDKVHP